MATFEHSSRFTADRIEGAFRRRWLKWAVISAPAVWAIGWYFFAPVAWNVNPRVNNLEATVTEIRVNQQSAKDARLRVPANVEAEVEFQLKLDLQKWLLPTKKPPSEKEINIFVPMSLTELAERAARENANADKRFVPLVEVVQYGFLRKSVRRVFWSSQAVGNQVNAEQAAFSLSLKPLPPGEYELRIYRVTKEKQAHIQRCLGRFKLVAT